MSAALSFPVSSWSWPAMGAPIANHLWQSTLFAAAAGLLTLALRKNQAQVRYWLWLIASLKFLVPFSLLVSLGRRLQWMPHPAIAQSQASAVVEEISLPFAPASSTHAALPAATSSFVFPAALLPALLLAVWLGGCVAVLFYWWWRWRRTAAALRRSSPVRSGREFETVRHLEQSNGATRQIELVISESTLEPGIVGVFRPVMLLPAGIAARLSDAELQAIITHELCHARRRDNLAAALHMLAEAIFWFHPLLWWVGARLVDERERACDEEVLRLGSEPQSYAEGILKVCEFYLESPLVCVAGVTGSNLKKRIEAIMIHRIAHKLEPGKKLLLATAAAAAIIAPVAFGLLHPSQSRADSRDQSKTMTPGFESVFIQPNTTGTPMAGFNIKYDKPGDFVAITFGKDRFRATNATLSFLIWHAYLVQSFQIVGGPDWVDKEKYDVDVKFMSSGADEADETKLKQQRLLQLQTLLADRFKLKLHREIRQEPLYELAIAPGGSKLHAAKSGDTYEDGAKLPKGRTLGPGLWQISGQLFGQGVSVGLLAQHLSAALGRAVVDKTGLTGNYDFTLKVPPGADQPASIVAAVLDQLGLQLNAQTGPVDLLVIDHAEPIEASSQLQPQADDGPPAIQDASIQPKGTAEGIVHTRVLQQRGATEFSNVSLQELVKFAYHVQDSQLSGAPAWMSSRLYDVNAKTKESAGNAQVDLELQKLLADRFKLAVHRETKELPGYELVVGQDGSKVAEVRLQKGQRGRMSMRPGQWIARGMKIGSLVEILERETGRPVTDKTGLNAAYDFTLAVPGWTAPAKTPDEAAPLLKAVSEQLGLELHPRTSPVEMLVIDHAEPVTHAE